jgi:hypothetical protein
MVGAYLVSVSGDIMVKKNFVWTGAALYALSTPFWVQVLRIKDLSSIAIVSSVVGNMILLAGARIFLGETLTGLQWLGAALGVISLSLM